MKVWKPKRLTYANIFRNKIMLWRPGIFSSSYTLILSDLFSVFSIGLMSRVFANGLGDRGSIPGQVIPKTHKTVLDAALLNAQYYKLRIKCKVEQSREWSSTLPLHLGVVVIEKGAFGSPSTKVANFTYICMQWGSQNTPHLLPLQFGCLLVPISIWSSGPKMLDHVTTTQSIRISFGWWLLFYHSGSFAYNATIPSFLLGQIIKRDS